MIVQFRHGLLVGLLLAGFPGIVHAQSPGLPPSPVAVLPPQDPSSTLPPPPPSLGAPAQPLAPPPYVPSQPFIPSPTYVPSQPFIPGPGVPAPPPPPFEPRFAPPGLYGTLEIDILFPQLRGFLSGQANVLGYTDSVWLNSASLEATGSPRVEVGWRMDEGLGAVAVSYRSVVSQGHEVIQNWDYFGDGFQRSRLNFNVVDIDYASPAYNVAPFWDLAWRAGLRGTAAFFDHTVEGGFADQQASDNFLGAGPHATVEVGRALDRMPGWAVTSKLDGALLFGTVTQHFDETLDYGPFGVFGGASGSHTTQTVPMVAFSAGLTYTPPACPQWARFGFGYEFEYWWNLGTGGLSRGDLLLQGLYFRAEFNF